MAGTVPTIKTRITLDGAEDVKAKLADIGVSGQRALDQIKDAGSALEGGGAKATEQLAKIGAHAIESSKAVEKFREALHIAHPALEEAGLGIGNLRAFSAAASIGIGGLGAAIAGGIVVGLAKLADKSEEARQHVTALFDNTEKGKKVFSDIEKSALETGRSIGSVTETYTSLTDVLQKQSNIREVSPEGGIQRNISGLPVGSSAVDIQQTLSNIIRAGTANQGEADAALKAIIQSLGENKGSLTAGGFGALPLGAQNSLARILGPLVGRPNNRESLLDSLTNAPVGPNQLAFGLSRAGPEALKESEKTKDEFINLGDILKENFNNFLTQLSNSSPAHAVVKEIYDYNKNQPANSQFMGDMAAKNRDDLSNTTNAIINSLMQLANKIANVKIPEQVGKPASQEITDLPGLAGGGYVSGPGSGTSDSILARLSNGEYIMPAASVSRVGTRFLDAIRGFADGGYVDFGNLPIPRFADGGPVSGGGMHPVTISFSGQEFGGLYAPSNVVRDLSQAAVDRRLRSGGPKPSHYR